MINMNISTSSTSTLAVHFSAILEYILRDWITISNTTKLVPQVIIESANHGLIRVQPLPRIIPEYLLQQPIQVLMFS